MFLNANLAGDLQIFIEKVHIRQVDDAANLHQHACQKQVQVQVQYAKA